MTDDFLSPDDHTPAAADDADDRPADDPGLDPLGDDDAPGLAREEHFGLTPPD